MKYLKIKCDKADMELINAAKEQYPNCDIIEEDSISGAEWVTIAIALAELSITIVDFILVHLASKKNDVSNSEDKTSKRVILSPEGELSFIGYSAKDVTQALKELGFEYDN